METPAEQVDWWLSDEFGGNGVGAREARKLKATPVFLAPAALLSFLHPAQGTPHRFPLIQVDDELPYWRWDSNSLPRNTQISQWPQTSLRIPKFSIKYAIASKCLPEIHMLEL